MMTKFYQLLLLCSIALLSACDKEINGSQLEKKEQACFRATIGDLSATIGDHSKARMTGSAWEKDDAIGIYALKSGQSISSGGIFDSKANIKYVTSGEDNNFYAATENAGITFSNMILDFIAYYPYQSSITDNKVSIDVSKQSNIGSIDLLYSNNATKKSIDSPTVDLRFDHMLSMIVINLEAGDGLTALTGLTASISGLKTNGTFNLNSKEIVLGDKSETISANMSTDGKTVSAILIPNQDMNNAKIEFKIGNNTFEWQPKTQTLNSGERYNYKLKLTAAGNVTLSSSSISGWNDSEIIDGGEIIVKPENGGNAGNGDGEETKPDPEPEPEPNPEPNPETPSTQGTLLFAGADFEDWDVFKESLYKNNSYLKQVESIGINESKALHYKDTGAVQIKVLAAKINSETLIGKSKISFYLKGTGTKPIHFSLDKHKDIGYGDNILYFGLRDATINNIIEPSTTIPIGTGSLDTKGEWKKVTLDISNIDSKDRNCFGFYALQAGVYDIYIDNITIE